MYHPGHKRHYTRKKSGRQLTMFFLISLLLQLLASVFSTRPVNSSSGAKRSATNCPSFNSPMRAFNGSGNTRCIRSVSSRRINLSCTLRAYVRIFRNAIIVATDRTKNHASARFCRCVIW